MKIGIIGCGKHAAAHVISLKESGLYDIISLCDNDRERLELFNKFIDSKNIIELTTDYMQCIDNPDVEAVLIVTHSHLHLEHLEYAVKKGKHVLIEKPLGVNQRQIDKITEIALTSKTLVMPALEYRYSSAFNNLLCYVNSDKLGGTNYITCSENRDNFFLPWFYDSKKSGGSINDKLIHEVDLITQIFAPSKPVSVYATGNQDIFKVHSEIVGMFEKKYPLDINDSVDNAFIIIEFANNKKACITMNMYHQMPVEGMQMYITGLNGNFCKISHLDTPDLIFTHNFDAVIKKFQILNPVDIDINGILHPGTKRMHELFYATIHSGKVDICNWEELRNAHLITLAAEKSIREKRLIDLKTEFSNPALEELICQSNLNKKTTPKEYLEFEMTEVKDNSKKIIRKNWLRRILRNRFSIVKNKDNYFRINKRDFNSIIKNTSQLYDFQGGQIKNNLTVEMILPWSQIYIDIKNGNINVLNDMPDDSNNIVKVEITESGYLKLATGGSLNGLYVTRQLKVSGDVDIAKEYQELFAIMFSQIRARISS